VSVSTSKDVLVRIPSSVQNLKEIIMRKCKLCSKSIEHKHVNAKFCNKKCKDNFHNITNPRGYFAHLANGADVDYKFYEDDHIFSSEALGQN